MKKTIGKCCPGNRTAPSTHGFPDSTSFAGSGTAFVIKSLSITVGRPIGLLENTSKEYRAAFEDENPAVLASFHLVAIICNF